ncbi:MAG: hypothetical protein IKN82_08035 [Treponema sp.]|nr:hypothetical protein [Treponema sp.]
MVFIMSDKIVEVSSWILKGNEIFSKDPFLHEVLDSLFSIKDNKEKWKDLIVDIRNQIEQHFGYIDLRKYEG